MRGPIINTGDALRITKDGVSWYDTGTFVNHRSKVNLVGFTVTDDQTTRTLTITADPPADGWDLREHVFAVTQRGHSTTGGPTPLSTSPGFQSWGKLDPTATGDSVTVTTDATGHYIVYGQSVNGSSAGWGGNTLDTQRRYEPSGYFIVRPRTLAASRHWVALVSSGPGGTDTPGASSGIHLAGFRYSQNLGDTNWMAVTSDGAADTVTDTGITATALQRFKLGLVLTSSQVEFYVNDVLEATHTTTLPGSTTDLSIFARVQKISGIGQATIDLARAVFRQAL